MRLSALELDAQLTFYGDVVLFRQFLNQVPIPYGMTTMILTKYA